MSVGRGAVVYTLDLDCRYWVPRTVRSGRPLQSPPPARYDDRRLRTRQVYQEGRSLQSRGGPVTEKTGVEYLMFKSGPPYFSGVNKRISKQAVDDYITSVVRSGTRPGFCLGSSSSRDRNACTLRSGP